ncbi:MAG: hypothetical protein ACKVX7_09720 [Planctomycetota bacterium]
MNANLLTSRGTARTFLVIFMLAMVARVSAQTTPEEKFPSLKEALESGIHGALKLKKEQIEVSYDFKAKEQLQDFRGSAGFVFRGNGVNLGDEEKPLAWEAGKLLLQREVRVEWRVALNKIENLSFGVGNLRDFAIELNGDEEAITVALGDLTRLNIGRDNPGEFDWSKMKSINLIPQKSYRIDVEIKSTEVTVKLDGKPILTGKVPEGFPEMKTCTFSSSSNSKPYVNQMRIAGRIGMDRAVSAANKSRLAAGKPPIWPNTTRVAGVHCHLATDASPEKAAEWLRVADAVAKAMAVDLPRTEPAPTPAPPGGTTPNQNADGAKAPGPLKIYVFTQAEVLAAYAGAPNSQVLPNGSVVLFENTEKGGLRPNDLGYMVAAGMLAGRYSAAAPLWWSLGIQFYYAGVKVDAAQVKVGESQPDLAALARDLLGAQDGLGIRDLEALRAKDWERGYPLAWAWVHFLLRSAGGAHRAKALSFDSALRAGKDPSDAFWLAFPKEQLAELEKEFKAYLETM